MKEILATIAVILAIAGNIPYLIDVFKKRVIPHPYTWLIWSIVSATIFFGQVAKGAGIGAIPTAASEIFTIIIFFFSLRYGWKGIVRTDTYFLIAALLGLVPWALTKDPTLSVVIMVSIDFVAFLPTLRKTWKFPQTETPLLYGTNVLRHFLALFSLQAYNIATMLHSIVMIVLNLCMTVFILKRRKKIATLFLQAVIVALGIGTLAFMLWEPHLEGRNVHATLFQIYFNDPFLAYAYTASIAFFIALYQAFKVLGYIRQNKTFSHATVKALRTIKYCAVALVALVAAPVAYLWIVRPGDDIAGGVAMGLFLIFISAVIATAAAVFERRVRDTHKKL